MLCIDLKGKIALVTGASGQLGRVMARTLGRAGADVAIHYRRDAGKANDLLAEIRGMGGRACVVQAEVGDPGSVFAMRDKVGAELGSPDIVVNNAVSQYKPWTTVLEQPAADYESQWRSCVMQNVLMAKAFVPAMIEKRWGRVIAISTECAMQNTPNQSAYVSGKRGMDGVLRVLAREVGQHEITVNQVAPGHTISDKYRGPGLEEFRRNENIPMKRRGEDFEVANVVAFLASDLASYVTGAFIPVCGGRVMPAI